MTATLDAGLAPPANPPQTAEGGGAGDGEVRLGPQPGAQTRFASTDADIAIYGGAAGAGKSFASLLEPLRHVNNGKFGAVIFRRTHPQIMAEGGLWDEASKIYPLVGAWPNISRAFWKWPSGAKVTFAHMQYEQDKHNWQGSQIALIVFDEATHFSRDQVFYMLSRNRSMSGVRPYMRMTCNPDADSWLAGFIEWWIDQETGYPIPERSGKVRWMVQHEGDTMWGDSPQELVDKYPATRHIKPKSVTFIAATIYDNPKLLESNPDYLSNLQALPLVERERLLGGNWKIKHEAGKIFPRVKWQFVQAAPAEAEDRVRFWDKAATAADDGKDPDFTVGVLMSVKKGFYFVEDVVRGQWGTAERDEIMQRTARMDALRPGCPVRTFVEQEPGSGGKDSALATVKLLAGYNIGMERPSGSKVSRAEALAAQQQVGNVFLVTDAEWNEPYVNELHAFPSKKVHDDQVDASSGAFNKLALHAPQSFDPEGWATHRR